MDELRVALDRIADHRAKAGALRYFADCRLDPRPKWLQEAMLLEKSVDDELQDIIDHMKEH